MRGVVVASPFVAEGPVLGWLDDVFISVSKQIVIPAAKLAPGWPEDDCEPAALRTQMHERDDDGESTDPVWAAVVALARQSGEDGRLWRLLACGLALNGLRAIDRRYRARTLTERCDIHADLIEGFLARLPTIDITRPNIASRLADAARRNLDKRRRRRSTDLPAEFDWLPHPSATPGSGPHNWTEALANIADDFTAAGHGLDPLGVELLGRTVIDGQTLANAAHDLGLAVEAAYKRRQRTEERIAAFYRIGVRRRASGRLKTVSRGAREDAA